jgi:hypothetical protein
MASDRQRATHRAERAVEPELTDRDEPRNRLRADLTRRHQEAERDREVEGSTLLSHVGRSEVHGDASRRQHEPRVDQRCRDTLPAFLDRARSQSDDRELRKPLGNIHLDGNIVGIDPEHGGGTDGGEHAATIARRWRTVSSIECRGKRIPFALGHPPATTVVPESRRGAVRLIRSETRAPA